MRMLMLKKNRPVSQASWRIDLALSVIMLLFGLVMIVPVVWMISTSFKPLKQVWLGNWIPNPVSLENYRKVFQRIPVLTFLKNSVIVSALVTGGQLVISTLAAYAFARINFTGRRIVFIIFLGTMMIPSYILIIPLYLIIQRLGIVNTYAALVLPKLVSVFGIYMLRGFFSAMPRDLDEAAYMDGASRLQILVRIFVPLAKPAYAALFIFLFMNAWNDFMWPLIVTSSEKMRTMQLGIAYFKDSNKTDYGATMAAAFLSSAPILLAFVFVNKQFVQSITMTGIKG